MRLGAERALHQRAQQNLISAGQRGALGDHCWRPRLSAPVAMLPAHLKHKRPAATGPRLIVNTAMPLISRCTRYAIFALMAGASLACASPVVDMYVPEAPPLTMLNQGDRHGIVGDIALAAMQIAGYPARHLSPPWPRAQREVSLGKDMLIAPLTRTQSREEHFTWIAPILSMGRTFFSLNKRVHSFDEAKSAFTLIAVGSGSAQEAKLREEGFSPSQIYPLKIGENPAQMLLKGRVDAWFNGVPETRYIWKQVSDRPLIMSPTLMTGELYLACSKDCNPQMVERLRSAIHTLQGNGATRTIQASYIKGLPVW